MVKLYKCKLVLWQSFSVKNQAGERFGMPLGERNSCILWFADLQKQRREKKTSKKKVSQLYDKFITLKIINEVFAEQDENEVNYIYSVLTFVHSSICSSSWFNVVAFENEKGRIIPNNVNTIKLNFFLCNLIYCRCWVVAYATLC